MSGGQQMCPATRGCKDQQQQQWQYTVQYHQSKLVQHCRFNRVRYTIQAVHTAATADQSLAPIADAVQQVEAKLLQKKTELRKFESEFRQVSKPLPPGTCQCAMPAVSPWCMTPFVTCVLEPGLLTRGVCLSGPGSVTV